jgi:hypothetical protein
LIRQFEAISKDSALPSRPYACCQILMAWFPLPELP